MISQQRIDELLFSEPNMVKIIRQVEIEATAELRAERDALRALLAEAIDLRRKLCIDPDMDGNPTDPATYDEPLKRWTAALRKPTPPA